MSRKVPKNSFLREEERKTKRNDPPGFVPWSNPNELPPANTHRNPTQGASTSAGHQRVVSSARRHEDASPSAEALSRPGRHPPVFVEETRPGAFLVPGIDNDGLTIEKGYDEQATIASHGALTVHVVARTVDTEEESRIHHQRDQFQHERDQFQHELDRACHERDQLHQILANAAVVTPIVATNRDEENGDESIYADSQDGLPRSDDPKCGTRGTRWFAVGAILLIVVAVVVTLALVLPSDLTKPVDDTEVPTLEPTAGTDAPVETQVPTWGETYFPSETSETYFPTEETNAPRTLGTVIPTDASTYAKMAAPSGSDSYFRKVYDTVYDGFIQETSCTTTTFTTKCFPRKRVDFANFALKAMGGLSDEDRLFIGDMYFRANSVFEFGIGESTDIAAATNLPRYVGVDSSSEWVKVVRDRTPDWFRFFFADVGKTGLWGVPVEDQGALRNTTFKMMLDYQIAPLFLEKKPFDVYMVDGRWRVACVMACFLHAMHAGGDLNKTRVILHDYRERTTTYGVVKEVATIEEAVGHGILLSLSPNVTEADLYDMWNRFKEIVG